MANKADGPVRDNDTNRTVCDGVWPRAPFSCCTARMAIRDPRQLVTDPCCATMGRQLNYDCVEHGSTCPDLVVQLSAGGRLFLEAKNASYTLRYCPWCGAHIQDDLP